MFGTPALTPVGGTGGPQFPSVTPSAATIAAAVAAGTARLVSLGPEAVDAARLRLLAALAAVAGEGGPQARLRAITRPGGSEGAISIHAAPAEGGQPTDIGARAVALARARVFVACAREAEQDAAARTMEVLAGIFPPVWIQQREQTDTRRQLRSRTRGAALEREKATYAAVLCIGRWGGIVEERMSAERVAIEAADVLRGEVASASEIVRLLVQKQASQ